MTILYERLSAVCSKKTTRLYSTSFSLGIGFLEPKIREPIYAVYGFVRLADEIVDSFSGYPQADLLTELKEECFKAIERGISVNPIVNSFQNVVNRFNIDHNLIRQFLHSMEMDLLKQYYNEEKYQEYILGSAQVVGLMCLRIFTNGNEQEYDRLKSAAMILGSAFQKVNFLRDINADYVVLDRSYFPGVDLGAFDEESKKNIENDIDAELAAAIIGIRKLPVCCRKGVYLAYIYYSELLKKIRSVPAQHMMKERIRVSNGHKAWLTVKALTNLWLHKV
jgi:phytoene synthase